MIAVDLFAGPGGWDIAAAVLGIDVTGVEFDDAACATREAAGLVTVQADVSALDPLAFPCDLLIASPPCQAFSMAGKGAGRAALGAYLEAIERTIEGKPPTNEELDEACDDERAHLVLEPLRWALALRPQYIALEQVRPVLPLWEAMGSVLRGLGYGVWTGLVTSEQYGVPQTRERAILIASLGARVGEPPVTHQRYIAPRVPDEATMGLFDAPEPERIVLPEDRELLPWVSMAQALGWGMTARPYPVIATSRSTGGPDKEKVGGSGARATLYDEQAAGRWALRATNERPNGAVRPVDAPAPTLAFGHNPPRWVLKAGTGEKEAVRSEDEPAPTVRFGARLNTVAWHVEYRRGGERIDESTPVDAPAPTITSRTDRWQVKEREAEPRDVDWPEKRPATTVAGDPRIAQPGHKNDEQNPDSPGRMEGAIRVSIEEAAVLQSFPPDYPWQGTKTKQFEQVGNAVPPLMALRILEHLIGGTS